jgi:hypothetical protein
MSTVSDLPNLEIPANNLSADCQRLLFHVEDSADGHYRDITSALTRRGWISAKKPSKFEKKKSFTAVRRGEVPLFLWTIGEKDSEFYSNLSSCQIINHFEGIGCLTKKNGLCDLLREMNWINQDKSEICPRLAFSSIAC